MYVHRICAYIQAAWITHIGPQNKLLLCRCKHFVLQFDGSTVDVMYNDKHIFTYNKQLP